MCHGDEDVWTADMPPGAMARTGERISQWILRVVLAVLVVGFVYIKLSAAQDAKVVTQQDVVNATVGERIDSLNKRMERYETTQNFAMTALLGNLIAHLFQIGAAHKRRARRNEP